ncbi:hypothetical protein [Streptomyces sp. CS014]|nr:hypothetical protein [Streptomyces sp. CS014]
MPPTPSTPEPTYAERLAAQQQRVTEAQQAADASEAQTNRLTGRGVSW